MSISNRGRATMLLCVVIGAEPVSAGQSAPSMIAALETFVSATYPSVQSQRSFGTIAVGPLPMWAPWQLDAITVDVTTATEGTPTLGERGSEDVQLSINWQGHF